MNRTIYTVLNHIPAVCTFIDESGKLRFVSQYAADFFGLTDHNDYITRFDDLSPSLQPCGTPSKEKSAHQINLAFVSGYSQFEWLHQTVSGKPLPCMVTLRLVKLGNAHGLVGYIEDRSVVHAEEDARQTYLRRLNRVIDNIPMLVAIWDETAMPVEVNEFAIKLFGIKSRTEYINNFLSFSPKIQPCGTSSHELSRKYIEQTFKDGEMKFEWLHTSIGGDIIPCRVKLIRIEWSGQPVVVSFVEDMRDFYRARDAEKLTRERLQLMLDSSPLLCAVFDENLHVLEVNAEAANILRLRDKQEYIDRFFDFCPVFQPDGETSAQKAMNIFNETYENGEYRTEWMHVDSAGQPVPCDVFLTRSDLNGVPIVIVHAKDMRREKELLKQLDIALEGRFFDPKLKARLMDGFGSPHGGPAGR